MGRRYRMIEVKMETIINSIPSLQKIISREMKTKVAFQIARLSREIERESNLFQEYKKQLVEKYGLRKENNELVVDERGNYNIEPKNIEAFNKEMQEILNEMVTLNANKIALSDLENEKFTPAEIYPLEEYIEE